jgi:hypothetical protein
MTMFAFDRSALAVIAPLALLVAAVLCSNLDSRPGAAQQARVEGDQGPQIDRNQTVAANLPSN